MGERHTVTAPFNAALPARLCDLETNIVNPATNMAPTKLTIKVKTGNLGNFKL